MAALRIVLTDEPGAASQFLAELRDLNLQKDRARFRLNLRRLGWDMALRISAHLPQLKHTVTTPHGTAECTVPAETPVLATILRAGLSFHEGFLEIFDRADCAFIGASRGQNGIDLGYTASPDLSGRTLVLCDPMLATGNSVLEALSSLKRMGSWKELYVCSVIASSEARELLLRILPDASLLIGAVDPELNARKEILPGLGDAGDLCFGEKLSLR